MLIVDDSALVRRILSDCLAGQPDIEVVGTAADPYIARDMILEVEPDVLTLDIEMPRMDGLTFLQKLMHYRPMPVIVISSLAQASCEAAMRALEEGAVEALGKPSGPYSVGDLKNTLAERIRAASRAKVRARAPNGMAIRAAHSGVGALKPASVIAIGASTGGTEAIREVLETLPENLPGTLITQHIPAGFSKAFSERLNHLCRMEVKEAEDGDELHPGRVLIAPGGLHMMLKRSGSVYRVAVKEGPRVCYQRPSVDVLFRSVADEAGSNAVAALLTGMGSDGASGLSQIRQAGGSTIAQNEETCVVYGMPREAVRLGAAAQVLPLQQVAPAILRLVSL